MRQSNNARSIMIGAGVLIAVVVVSGLIYFQAAAGSRTPIKVGILHSLSGTMAISERGVADATMMAIDEINAAGGLLGRRIEPVLVDGKSDWDVFKTEAERLITQEKVSVVFGCWTSACRKTVRPVFEQYHHLLIYPVEYEGLEMSPNIIYTGAAPNQQIIPAVKWSMDNLGKQFFLVGSDYVFPHAANEIIKLQVQALGGQIAGEEYALLGSTDFDAIVQKIVEMQPNVILNTLNGDSNAAFFSALRAAGITSTKIPTVSFSIGEAELSSLDIRSVVGDYAAWNYFQSVPGADNARFVENFQTRYGANRVTSDPMSAAYFGVYLWAQAVKDAGTDNVAEVNEAMLTESFNAPDGVVYIDPETRHTWKTVRIGQIQQNGQFRIVWDSGSPVRPAPFPSYRTQDEWNTFLDDLYQGWGGQWANQAQK